MSEQISPEDQAFMGQAMFGFVLPQALNVAASLGVADLLASRPQTAGELAAATGVDANFLYRILRFLASHGIFTEADGKRFELNGRSQLLRSGVRGSIRTGVLYLGDQAMWSAIGALTDAVRSGKSAFESLHGVGVFEYLANHPALATYANEFMTQRRDHSAVARSRDFSQASVVIDVGGGHGATLIEILKAHAHLRGVLFDLPRVVGGVDSAALAPEIQERLAVLGGNFFEAVPEGGDVYLLEDVLHDWDDGDCLRILSVCRKAMRPGTELLVAERLLPDSGSSPQLLTLDIMGLALLGSQERTEAEFRALFERSAFRFKSSQRVTPVLALVAAEAI